MPTKPRRYGSVKEIVEGMQASKRSPAFIRMNVARFMVMNDPEYMDRVDREVAMYAKAQPPHQVMFYNPKSCKHKLRKSKGDDPRIYWSDGTRWVQAKASPEQLETWTKMPAAALKRETWTGPAPVITSSSSSSS